MSTAEGKVADLVLRDPEAVATSTMMELKGRLNVSEATIVRAARSLGFAGYPQLRLSLAAAAGQRRGVDIPVVTGDIARDDSTAEVIHKLSAAEQQALRETAARLDPERLDAAANALAAAGRVLTFGVGASALVAQDLHEKLARAGVASTSPSGTEPALTSAALLNPGDVAVLISDRGRTGDTLEVVAIAHERGATTIAITGAEASPLAERADHVLVAAGHDMELRPAALSSRMGQLLVIDCLFVGFVQRTWTRTSEALAQTRAAVEKRRRPART
jgi:DNA-binding MurR/RpiR family transcriptional regulator